MAIFNNLNIYQKMNFIVLNIQAIIGVLGIIGNLLVIIVFMRQSLRKYSYSFYCQMKAFADIVVLLFGLRNWANFFFDANLELVSEFLCVIGQFMPFMAGAFALGILVLISLDRVLTVIYPNRFKWLKKRWFQVMIVFVIAIYTIGLNLVLPLNTRYAVFQVRNRTVIFCMVPQAISNLQSWLRNGNILLIILGINNFLNIKLVKYIVSSRKRVANNSQASRISGKDRKMAVSAIGLGLTALFCKLPLGIINILTTYLSMPFDQTIMIIYIAVTVLVLENAASFFINMFFNTMFYSEFMRMLGVKTVIQLSATGKRTASNTNNQINANTN